MIVRIHDVLFNLANVLTIEKDGDNNIMMTFVDGSFKSVQCPFEELSEHLGYAGQPTQEKV